MFYQLRAEFFLHWENKSMFVFLAQDASAAAQLIIPPPHPSPWANICSFDAVWCSLLTLKCVNCTYKPAKLTLADCLVGGAVVIWPPVSASVYLCRNLWRRPDISPEGGPTPAEDATEQHCDFAPWPWWWWWWWWWSTCSPLPLPSTSSTDCNAPPIPRSRFTNAEIKVTNCCRPRPTTHILPEVVDLGVLQWKYSTIKPGGRGLRPGGAAAFGVAGDLPRWSTIQENVW